MRTLAVPKKWRPTLTMIVAGMLAIVLALPVASLLLFRFFDTQLVRQTEGELIVQGALLAATMEQLVGDESQTFLDTLPRVKVPIHPTKEKLGKYNPILPKLDLGRDKILPPRTDAIETNDPVRPEFVAIGQRLTSIILNAQKTTLAGYRVLDPQGRVIAGREDIGLSLAHVHEVQTALQGKYSSVIRERLTDRIVPPIASISRGTGIRVFATFPVLVEDRLAGIIYLSRTPSNVLKELYQQRWQVFLAALFILFATLSMTAIFIRTVKRPIELLRQRSERIGQGDRSALSPQYTHGSREVAHLAEQMQEMAQNLFDRSDYIDTFAKHVSHELKSPLTSIQGAAELLRDQNEDMDTEQRNRFLDNISKDTDRSVLLLDRLRELARADNPLQTGTVAMRAIVSDLKSKFSGLEIIHKGDDKTSLAMAPENATVVFSNLVENAAAHGADRIEIRSGQQFDHLNIEISDNGNGISQANIDKIFDLFFTTRRQQSGTGMGLGIVRAMLKAHKGDITLKTTEKNVGTTFLIKLPAC